MSRDHPARALAAALDDPRRTMPAGELALAQRAGLPVNANRFARTDHAGMALGISLALLLGALTLYAMAGGRSQVAVPRPPPRSVDAPVSPAVVAPPPVAPVLAPPAPVPIQPALGGLSLADRERSVALIYDTSQPGATRPDALLPLSVRLNGAERFALRLAGAGDFNAADPPRGGLFVLARGTVIAAVLETVVADARPGQVRAVIIANVLSADGRRVLIPRGARALGKVQRASPGLTGATVQWIRVLQPDGLAVALGPAAPGGGTPLLLSVIAPGAMAGRSIRILAAHDLDFAGTTHRP